MPILYWTKRSQPHQFLATVIGLAEVPNNFLLEPVQGQQIDDHNVESEAMPRGQLNDLLLVPLLWQPLAHPLWVHLRE